MRHNSIPHSPAVITALTIAGSDSCGGAGIQADLRSMTRWGVEGASVVTAVTAQNTLAVSAVAVMNADLVYQQLQAVFTDLPIRAVKTGMLANAEIIQAVVAAIDEARRHQPELKLVVDPVMVATAGARLLDQAAETVMREALLPRADLLTPNLPEAQALLGGVDTDDAQQLGLALQQLGCKAVLVKGGHAQGAEVEDWLIADSQQRFVYPRHPAQIHGTGCTLSAAITAALALGLTLPDAVASALDWLHGLIAIATRPLRGQLAMLPVAGGPAPQLKR